MGLTIIHLKNIFASRTQKQVNQLKCVQFSKESETWDLGMRGCHCKLRPQRLCSLIYSPSFFSDFIVEDFRIQENIVEQTSFVPGEGLTKFILSASNPLTLFFTSVRILHGKEKKAVGKHSCYAQLVLRAALESPCRQLQLRCQRGNDGCEIQQYILNLHSQTLPTFYFRTRHMENLKGKLEGTFYPFHLVLHTAEDIQNRGFCSLLDIFTLLPYF